MSVLPPTNVVWTTLVVYFLTLFAIGAWARRRTRDGETYFIGGRRLGALVGSLSYAAGSSSAWTILGVSGIAFSQGLSAIWLLPGTLTGHVLAWFWLGRRLNGAAHQNRWVTLNDLIADGVSGRRRTVLLGVAAVAVAVSFTFYVAAQFQGAAATFANVMEVERLQALLLGAGILLAYTLLGGFWAVSVTDALQALLMLVAALLLPWFALSAAGGIGGLGNGLAAVASSAQLSLIGDYRGLLAAGFLLGMFSIGFGPLGQPHLLNRIMAIRDLGQLRTARVVALVWFVVVLSGMFLLGLCGHVLLVDAPPEDSEQIFFALTNELLPTVLAGVIIAAVLSAIMSTADSQLLVAASAVSHDLMRSSSLLVSRLVVLAVGLLAVCVAYGLPEAIFSRVLFAWNALGAAFGPAVIVRLLRWRVRATAVTWAVAMGFGLTVILYFAAEYAGRPGRARRALPNRFCDPGLGAAQWLKFNDCVTYIKLEQSRTRKWAAAEPRPPDLGSIRGNDMKVDGELGLNLATVGERARELEAMGYSGIMTAETSHDPFFPLLLAAQTTTRVDLMTGIAVAFARSPMTLANIGHDLNVASKGRFVLGLGSQIRAHITKRFSMSWSSPAARMREFILAMRAIWANWHEGEPLQFMGKFYKHTLMTPFFYADRHRIRAAARLSGSGGADDDGSCGRGGRRGHHSRLHNGELFARNHAAGA